MWRWQKSAGSRRCQNQGVAIGEGFNGFKGEAPSTSPIACLRPGIRGNQSSSSWVEAHTAQRISSGCKLLRRPRAPHPGIAIVHRGMRERDKLPSVPKQQFEQMVGMAKRTCIKNRPAKKRILTERDLAFLKACRMLLPSETGTPLHPSNGASDSPERGSFITGHARQIISWKH